MHTPLLLLHITCALIGLLSGFLAMVVRKGSGWHGAAGNVFFVSMLLMSSGAVYLATVYKPNSVNVLAGMLTFYLVSTAWLAARRREARVGLFDTGAMLFILAVAVRSVAFGIEAVRSGHPKDGMPTPLYFVFGTAALLCAVTDVRMLLRGGVSGTRRLVRHLWRMSMALLIATLSFYPGQAKLFPMWLRETKLLMLPHLLLIGILLYSVVRVRGRKRASQTAIATIGHAHAIVTT
jgi:hypothetical protein